MSFGQSLLTRSSKLQDLMASIENELKMSKPENREADLGKRAKKFEALPLQHSWLCLLGVSRLQDTCAETFPHG